jgi:hypothetical protein
MAVERVLVWGCGGMRWFRLDQGPFGAHWESGLFGSFTGLSNRGTQHGLLSYVPSPVEGRVSLAAVMDAAEVWRPGEEFAGEAGIERLQPQPGAIKTVVEMPERAALARAIASWASVELGGVGALVVRSCWNSPEAQEILHGFSEVGWELAIVEEALPVDSGNRLLTTDGLFVHIEDADGTLIMPSDPHAARALAQADRVYKAMLGMVGAPVAAAWYGREDARQGWFCKQQIAFRLAHGLRAGDADIALGGAEAPVFGALQDTSRAAFADLYALRVQVQVPPADTSDWFQKASWPGFLRNRSGRIRIAGLDWSARTTLEFEGPDTRPELAFMLGMQGHPRKTVAAKRVREGLGAVLPFQQRFPAFLARGQEPIPVDAPEIRGPDRKPPPTMVPAEPDPVPQDVPAPAPVAAPEPAAPAPFPTTRPTAPPPAPAPTRTPAPTRPPPVAEVPPVVAEPPPSLHEAPTLVPPPDPPPEPPPRIDLPTPPAPERRPFHPQRFELHVPHRPETMRVWVDGKVLRQPELQPIGGTRGDVRLLQIDGVDLAHGAVVRVDYDPAVTEDTP